MAETSSPIPLRTGAQELARLLRARRAELGWTQQRVAEEIGVKKGTIGLWEKGASRTAGANGPQKRVWASIATFLELPSASAVGAVLEGAVSTGLEVSRESAPDDKEAARQVLARLACGPMSPEEIRLAERSLDALRTTASPILR